MKVIQLPILPHYGKADREVIQAANRHAMKKANDLLRSQLGY